MTVKRDKFYKHGIRFECQGTGKCCRFRGIYGYVYLSLTDRRRLAAHLGMTTRAFTLKSTDKTEGLFHLKRNIRHCPFLKDGQCIVYDSRPTQCRTWPFWPDNMSPSTWKKEIESFCPGIGKGKLYSTEEIDVILNEHKKECNNY
mgnify:CR=1 FL=1